MGARAARLSASGLTRHSQPPKHAANDGTTGGLTFAYTGAVQNFTVPAGVNNLNIAASGAQGGNGRNGATGGRGAYAEGRVLVTPGQVLSIVVGQAGGNGTGSSVAGGGGGGGSYTSGATNVVTRAGDRSGDGTITLSW